MKKKILMILFAISLMITCTACANKETSISKVEENNSDKTNKSGELNDFLESSKDTLLFINYVDNRYIIGNIEEEQLVLTIFDREKEKIIASIKTRGLNSYFRNNLKFYKDGFVFEEDIYEDNPSLVVYDYDLNEKQRIELNPLFDNRYNGSYALTNDLTTIAYFKYDEVETLKGYLIIKDIASNTVLDTIEFNPKSTEELAALSQFSFSEDDKYIYYYGFSPKEVKEITGYESIEYVSSYGVIDLETNKIDNTVLKEISFVSNETTAIVGFNSEEPEHTTAREHIFVMMNGSIEKVKTSGMESEFIQIADEGNAFILTDKLHEESTNTYSTYRQRLFVNNKEVLTISPKDFGVDDKVHYNDIVSVVIDEENEKLYYFYRSNKDGEMIRTEISFDGR